MTNFSLTTFIITTFGTSNIHHKWSLSLMTFCIMVNLSLRWMALYCVSWCWVSWHLQACFCFSLKKIRPNFVLAFKFECGWMKMNKAFCQSQATFKFLTTRVESFWRNDTELNDTQHNGTYHNAFQQINK